ncbi:MAG: hydroxymethylbilane synthase [Beijerinckiaceae bacterium]|nr:hydroxymethylbilane synthase [Beijerinckiaceae bacterium]
MKSEAVQTIGTRGSPLALAQAHMTAKALADATGLGEDRFPLDIIKTTGDLIQDRALSESGGKGLFTKEIDEAQLSGRVDIAVHSGKDLPTVLPEGLVVAGYLPRADVRDVFIGHGGLLLQSLPAGARVGTASLRRQAQLLRAFPKLRVELIRGNVQTRLGKVESGEYAGTLLALAGLTRLGLADRATQILDIDAYLPAVAQGAIALVTRKGDEAASRHVASIGDEATRIAVSAERAFLHELDGSCRTPIAGHATLDAGSITLRVLVMSPDGKRSFEDSRSAPADDAVALGAALGQEIKAKLPPGFFDTGH